MSRLAKSLGVTTFALDDGEVDLGLVEPGRVDRGVYEHEVRPGALESVDRAFAAVRGAVVDDHEPGVISENLRAPRPI